MSCLSKKIYRSLGLTESGASLAVIVFDSILDTLRIKTDSKIVVTGERYSRMKEGMPQSFQKNL